MVTRDTPYLTRAIFLDTVVKKTFPLLSLVWHLFKLVSGDRYLTRGSNGNAFSITKIGNMFVSRWVPLLVTRLFMDFVMIH